MSKTGDNEYCVLVTGANAGLGNAICRRLIDEFLYLRPQSQCLTLIITTRSEAKSAQTLIALQRYIAGKLKQTNAAEQRVRLESEILDLLSLPSVQSAAKRIVGKYRKLDVVILNAGVGGWTTMDWLKAARQILTGPVTAVTWPEFKLSSIGGLAKSQVKEGELVGKKEPPLGEVFCANVFGHYMLTHHLMRPLSRSASGRIIWVSTIEAHQSAFLVDDFQSIRSPAAYESTKRLTDILALTSDLPSAAPWADSFFSIPPDSQNQLSSATSPSRPRMFLTHPGVCATGIFPMMWILNIAMLATFYIARWMGSMWHTIEPYTAACSMVWLALASEENLDSLESRGGVSKWGSATDGAGYERVERTEVEGWGYGGRPGDTKGRITGRKPGAVELTKEAREKFEELGRVCWKEMEELRIDWESCLASIDISQPR